MKASAAHSQGPLLTNLLVSLRPHQWVKNAFVFAPLVFGLKFGDVLAVGRVFLAFVAFSLAASATYLINDLLDREQDRRNPRTRNRPIARGDVTPIQAAVSAAFLVVLSIPVGLAAGIGGPLIAYLLVSQGYSLVLKKVAVLDVVSIATLYLVRLLAGARAAQVPPSPWLLVCGGLLALLLALGKRLEQQNGHYPRVVLLQGSTLVAVLTAVAYALYSAQPTTRDHLSPWFVLTNLPVVAGLFRYVRLAVAGCADPSEALFRDRWLKAWVLAWGIMVLALVYRGFRGPC